MPGPQVPIWTIVDSPVGTGDGRARTFAPLTEDLQVDVAIVGAGITGLTLGVLLAAEGARVAVLERARIASGDDGPEHGPSPPGSTGIAPSPITTCARWEPIGARC